MSSTHRVSISSVYIYIYYIYICIFIYSRIETVHQVKFDDDYEAQSIIAFLLRRCTMIAVQPAVPDDPRGAQLHSLEFGRSCTGAQFWSLVAYGHWPFRWMPPGTNHHQSMCSTWLDVPTSPYFWVGHNSNYMIHMIL